MSNRALDCAWRAKIKSPAQKAVLTILADYANQDFEAFPSVQTMSDCTAYSERAVRMALRDLEAGGWVERHERVDAKTGRMKTALYRLIFVYDPDRMRAPKMLKDGASAAGREGASLAGGGGTKCRGEGAADAPEPLERTPNEEASLTRSCELPLGLPESGVTKKVKPPPKIDLAPLVETWNAICGSTVGRILKVTPEREKLLRRAMEDEFENDPERWTAFCRKVTKSTFLTGKATKFKPDFNWMLGQENLVKILEGRYHDAPAPSKAPYAGYNPHLRPGDPGWRPSPGTI